MKGSFISALSEVAREDERVLALVADNGAIVFDQYRAEFPERFVNVGIAEANTVGIAAGLASCGKIPFAYTLCSFLTMRAFEQIRNDVCLQALNVKLIGIGAGFTYSNLGPSHQATKDLSLMRPLPGMTVLSPADGAATAWATTEAARLPGPVYMRLGKVPPNPVHKASFRFELGKGVPLRSGDDVAVIATGALVADVLEAAEVAKEKGLSVRVIDIHTIKPIDSALILSAARQTRAVLTVEEHSIFGGLGSAVAEVLAENQCAAVRFRRLGLQEFPTGYGTYEDLKQMNGLSVEHICKAIQELHGEKTGRASTRPRLRAEPKTPDPGKKLLYSRMKPFHYLDKVQSLPQTNDKILAPVHIRIKPTNVCNHNCWYCAYKVDNLQLGKDMYMKDSIPEDKITEIIEDIIDMGVRAVTFSGGGEPFVYPHLATAAKRLAASPVRFASLTNGSRLEGEAAEVFAHGGTWLRVSIDGWDDESYARYRKCSPKEFTRVMNNMTAFKALGGQCRLGVSLVIDEHNAPHLYDFATRIKSAGADSIKMAPCIVSNDGGANNDYHLPFFDRVKEQIQRATDDLAGPDFEIYDSYHELSAKFGKEYGWCPYVQMLTVIGANLSVYSCQDKAYNEDRGLLGSIKDSRFRDFWFSDKRRFFKIDPSKDCDHHCVSNAKNHLLLEYLDADPVHSDFV